MQALGNMEMLEILERGGLRSHPERALVMLAAGCPDQPEDSLLRLSLGDRDRSLLDLRRHTFGNLLQGVTDCPSCRSDLTVDLEIDQLLFASPIDEKELTASIAGYELRFRSPNSEDLLSVLDSSPSDVHPFLALAQRILRTTRGGTEFPAAALPPEVLDQATELIEASDPAAELRLIMRCPDCGSAFSIVFDIVSFFWNEISAHVRRLLAEVHVLASTYGWSEQEILRLSPWRRAAYLGMVN